MKWGEKEGNFAIFFLIITIFKLIFCAGLKLQNRTSGLKITVDWRLQ